MNNAGLHGFYLALLFKISFVASLGFRVQAAIFCATNRLHNQ